MPLQNIFEIDVDIKQKTAIKTTTVTQNDAVVFIFRIFDEGRIYNIQSGTTFTMTATRPDKVTVITEGTVTDENIVDFTLGTTELAVAGKVNTVVQVYDAEGRISTIPFGYYVLNDPSTDYIPSEHEETLIERVLGDGPQVIDDAEQAGDYAQSVADENKTTWLTPVATYEDITTTYVEPNHGDTIMTHTDGKIYRYFNGTWNHTQTYTDSALTSIQNQLSEQKQQDKVLVHGLNVLSSDQPSPVNVEFYGVTRANLLGREGGFYGQGKWNGYLSIDNTVSKLGTNSGLIDNSEGTSSKRATNDTKNKVSGKYVLLGVWAKAKSGNPNIYLKLAGYNADNAWSYTQTKEVTIDSQWKYYYFKVDLTNRTEHDWRTQLEVATYGTQNDIVNFDGLCLYEISQSTYDKIGDLSLIGKDQEYVEKAFPYVSGVQSVVNPVIRVQGQQLFNINNVDLHTNAEVTDPRTIVLNATGAGQTSTIILPAKHSTTYTLSLTHNGWVYIDSVNGTDQVQRHYQESGSQELTFTTSSNANGIKIFMGSSISGAGTYTFSNIMLNLGDEPKPYTDYNPSYLYAYKVNEETGENEPLILAGNDDKKDISYYNFDKRRWEVKREFKTNDVLDGSLDWALSQNGIGYKMFSIPDFVADNSTLTGSQIFVKFDGSLITTSSTIDEYDKGVIYQSTGRLEISVSNVDTGFTDSMYPDEDLIKSYFHGWKYTGDGTTHSWVAITDSTVTSTDILHTSTTKATEEYTPYKLTYQLAEPIVEEVRVEGDLSIQGDAQVEVGSGVVVREKISNSQLKLVNGYYNLNYGADTPSWNYTWLKNKVAKFIGFYEGTEDFTNSWNIYSGSQDTIRGHRAAINEANIDMEKDHYVTYEILDKHDFTTNVNEVVAYYQSSLKSSFQSVVSKQSGIATDQTILKRQMLDVLVRLDALEGTE
jgi:hypothetical protein